MSAAPGNQYAKKDPEDKASSHLTLRVKRSEKSAWVRAANKQKIKLSHWVCDTLNLAAQESRSKDK